MDQGTVVLQLRKNLRDFANCGSGYSRLIIYRIYIYYVYIFNFGRLWSIVVDFGGLWGILGDCGGLWGIVVDFDRI